jgi:hypothetical protein
MSRVVIKSSATKGVSWANIAKTSAAKPKPAPAKPGPKAGIAKSKFDGGSAAATSTRQVVPDVPLVPAPFSRVITSETGKLAYDDQVKPAPSVRHDQMRQQILAEIEFLTKYGALSQKVLYLGRSAKHLEFLTTLFPSHHFIVYNNEDQMLPNEHYEFRSEPFTDSTALLYTSAAVVSGWLCPEEVTDRSPILMISNLMEEKKPSKKFAPKGRDPAAPPPQPKKMREVMDDQKRWYLIIKPLAAMINFKLPYTPGVSSYLKGEKYFEIWGPATGTQTKLWLVHNSDGGEECVEYEHQDYESILFHHNIRVRDQTFENTGKKYDTTAELHVLSGYLSGVHQVPEEEMVENVTDLRATFDDFIATHGGVPAFSGQRGASSRGGGRGRGGFRGARGRGGAPPRGGFRPQ